MTATTQMALFAEEPAMTADVPMDLVRNADAILLNTSGGKDSQAMISYVAGLAAEAGVLDRIVALHCDLGRVEWSGTRQLAELHALHYGLDFEVRSRNEKGDLLDQVAERQMWPSADVRYCTAYHKRELARQLIRSWDALYALSWRRGIVLDCLGIRAAESSKRAKKLPLTQDTALTTRGRSVFTWLPIHSWSDEQVWQQIADSGLPYSPVYDAGMRRLSCSFCVLASEEDLVCAARLRPRMADEYAALEARIGHSFKADLTMADVVAQARTLGRITRYTRGEAMRDHLGNEVADAYLRKIAA
ncbi:phosphoadenosine phosphosulfate reductase domain-containing protein [Streptomyces sp. NEAU-174]|uniref:phosphoadenosine phosphosulfate reductase domain-containing protein n=1 Tax=Streptomyces sp. NEAU-174 TaxID=3458254 RepID=UPI00404505C5